MTILDLADSCRPRLSHSEAKRIAFEKVPRLRACDWRIAELEPPELFKLRGPFQVAAEAKAKGPDLPGLEPGALPQVYIFGKWRVRVALRDGKPWFVARDVAEALEYPRFDSNLISHVPEKWKGTNPIRTPGGEQHMLVLSLEGLFHFLNRSDKPAAQPFQEWVNGEVLVSIHETGGYQVPAAKPSTPARPATARLPCGAQLHELRMIYGNAAAKRLDYLIGYEVRVGPVDEKAPLSIAEPAFRALRDLATGQGAPQLPKHPTTRCSAS